VALYQVALPSKLLGGITAFTPNMTRMAASGAQMYKHAVSGQPGTRGIPAPTGGTQMQPDAGDKAQMGTARSSDAPDMWYPNKYYERSLDGDGTMGPVVPARVFTDNLMPVPAQDPRGLPALLAFTPHFLGQQQIRQPRNMPTWGNSG
jgi:hypothetical protein